MSIIKRLEQKFSCEGKIKEKLKNIGTFFFYLLKTAGLPLFLVVWLVCNTAWAINWLVSATSRISDSFRQEVQEKFKKGKK